MKTKKGFALKRSSIGAKLFEIALYGIAVISTMLLCLLPFLLSDDPLKQISQILFRLFPFGRGLFEDKGLRLPRMDCLGQYAVYNKRWLRDSTILSVTRVMES